MKKTPEWGYKLLKPILAPLFKLYYRPILKNIDLIPSDGPIILAGNHRHIMDQCLAILSTRRVIHFMAKREYFDGPFAWFFKLTGVIRVDRSIKDTEAKRQAVEILKSGGAIGIFPEGTRNRTEEMLLPFKYGTVAMAKKTGAYIVPFAIKGNYCFRSRDLSIEFAMPFKVGDNETLEVANEKLKKSIKDILEED